MSKQRNNVRMLTLVALMSAITVILASTPIGLISLPTVSGTTAHIPTIIIAILEGPVAGAISGLIFGLFTLFMAITRPTGILDPYFVNPLISVLPRVLIGVTASYSYQFMSMLLSTSKHKDIISFPVGSAIGSITNTVGALGLLYLIYGKPLSQAIQEQFGMSLDLFFVGIITTNSIFEMFLAMIVATPIAIALKKAFYK